MSPSSLTLILGGARSGKSAYAEKMAAELGQAILYVATAEARDDEMSARIAAHKAQRPAHWQTIEAPTAVATAIHTCSGPFDVVLLDCLTLLGSNVITMLPEPVTVDAAEAAIGSELDALLATYRERHAHWLIVSNEVGLGLAPPYPLGRVYRDVLGRANQRLAGMADQVIFMVAGLPWVIKPHHLSSPDY